MKTVFQKRPVKGILFNVILPLAILQVNTALTQSSPPPVTTTVTSYSNAYSPVQQELRVVNTNRNGTQEELNISPVTATSYSAITWSSDSDIELDITLFDGAGNTVLNRQYPLKKGVNELLLTNLETLPAGLYFVKAFDGTCHRNGKLIIHRTL